MQRRAAGFTLLELVVVLAILGAVTALVAPATVRGIDRWRVRLALQDLEQQFSRLPILARDAGINIDHAEGEPWPAGLPPLVLEGARLEFVVPLVVRSNGYCESGRVRIVRGEAARVAEVLPPFCRLDITLDEEPAP